MHQDVRVRQLNTVRNFRTQHIVRDPNFARRVHGVVLRTENARTIHADLRHITGQAPSHASKDLTVRATRGVTKAGACRRPVSLQRRMNNRRHGNRNVAMFRVVARVDQRVNTRLLRNMPITNLGPQDRPHRAANIIAPGRTSNSNLRLTVTTGHTTRRVTADLPHVGTRPLTVQRNRFLFLTRRRTQLRVLSVRVRVNTRGRTAVNVNGHRLHGIVPVERSARKRSTPPHKERLHPSRRRSLKGVFRNKGQAPLSRQTRQRHVLNRFVSSTTLTLTNLTRHVTGQINTNLAELKWTRVKNGHIRQVLRPTRRKQTKPFAIVQRAF